jgi:hypothetical protein
MTVFLGTVETSCSTQIFTARKRHKTRHEQVRCDVLVVLSESQSSVLVLLLHEDLKLTRGNFRECIGRPSVLNSSISYNDNL